MSFGQIARIFVRYDDLLPHIIFLSRAALRNINFTGYISSYLTHHHAINVYCYDPDMNKSTFLYRIPFVASPLPLITLVQTCISLLQIRGTSSFFLVLVHIYSWNYMAPWHDHFKIIWTHGSTERQKYRTNRCFTWKWKQITFSMAEMCESKIASPAFHVFYVLG